MRDILALMNELLNNKVWQILAPVEKEYYRFMENELVEWVTLMLQCGAFQSYSSIVTPYESQEFRRKPDGSRELSKINEGLNYQHLQRRYMKTFMRVYHKMTSSTSLHSRQAHVMSVIDSDFDEDDEYNQGEIDEIFSISPPTTGDMDLNSQEIIFNIGNTHEDFYGCGGGAGSEFDSEEKLKQNIVSHIHDQDDDEDFEDDIDYYCPSGPSAINA